MEINYFAALSSVTTEEHASHEAPQKNPETVLNDSDTDSSCEVVIDEGDVTTVDNDVIRDDFGTNCAEPRPRAAPPGGKRKEFESPPVSSPNDDDALCQPSPSFVEPRNSSGQLTEIDFLQQFVDYVKEKSITAPDTQIANVADQFFDQHSRLRPLGFRKLLEKGNLRKVKSVTIPPSQVVHMTAEFEPELSLKDFCPPSSSDQPMSTVYSEMTHKLQFANQPSPNFTRVLYDIGYSLALESTYRTIISRQQKSSKKNPQIVTDTLERVKKTFEELKLKNKENKISQKYKCKSSGCQFVCESKLALSIHQQHPHRNGNRFVCALCDSCRSADQLDITRHYLLEHDTKAVFEHAQAKHPCTTCDDDFSTKGELLVHRRLECLLKNRTLKTMYNGDADVDVVNKRLWPLAKSRLSAAQQHKVFTISSQGRQNPTIKPKPLNNCDARIQQNKGVRKSVSDIVNLVSSGQQGRMAPGYLTPFRFNSPNFVTRPQLAAAGGAIGALPTILTMTGGQTFLLRNGNSLSVLNPAARFMTSSASTNLTTNSVVNVSPSGRVTSSMVAPPGGGGTYTTTCEICDAMFETKLAYVFHLRESHKKLLDKHDTELTGPAPLACSRCKDRFYTYEGLERHLLMKHCLVTSDLLDRAHRRQDNGKCKLCGKIYAFNLLQHLVQDHRQQLCSAEILYSCDLCSFQCKSYVLLESHLKSVHGPSIGTYAPGPNAQQAPSTAGPRPIRPVFPRQAAPQSVAAVIADAMVPANRKRPLNETPPGARGMGPFLSPSKMPRLPRSAATAPFINGPRHHRVPTTPQQSPPRPAYRSQARAEAGRHVAPPAPRLHQQQAAKQKQLKYCCTPCGLKFQTYAQVVHHWADRHLRKFSIGVCRVDQCNTCRSKLADGNDALRLDFTQYEAPSIIDEDLEIVSERKSRSRGAELICLD